MKKMGLLIVNLGTPHSFHLRDVFCYLNEFLTDERVIDLPWLHRQLLVRGIIVPFRFRQSAAQYSRLWTKEGSPLLVHGKAVQEKLQQVLGNQFKVVLAMRYQSPSILEGLEQLKKEQVDEINILPLFPQYASATTGSVHQKVMECLQKWTTIPKLIFINNYCDHPAFIEALCLRAKQYSLDTYDHILFSFHGLPEKQIRQADKTGSCMLTDCCQTLCHTNRFCYKAQCFATVRAIVKRLNLDEKNYTICFQSRLGKDPWIQPYAIDVLQECASKGYKRLLVFAPSFVCDCLETICEIMHEYHQEFKACGGEELQLVEGLNSHPAWIKALENIVLEQISQPVNNQEDKCFKDFTMDKTNKNKIESH